MNPDSSLPQLQQKTGKMEKGLHPPESAPPYPGPPLGYNEAPVGPQPAFYPQSYYPNPPTAPFPPGNQGGHVYPAPAPSVQMGPGVYPAPPVQMGPGVYPAPPVQMGPGVYPAPAPPVPITTVTHLLVTPAATLHEVPGQTVCPHCHCTVVTTTEHKAGIMAWAVCAGLTFFGCIPCCLIPFCIDSCLDVVHRCSLCYKVIHIHKRL